MINTIATIIGTGIAVGSATGVVLSGFYKTNKEADSDHQAIEEKFDSKLEKLETRLQHEIELSNKDVKGEFKNIADKIDEMKTRYVTNENFKTYVDSVSQLLKMTSDRMTRMETTLDDIRDDINSVIRNHQPDHFTNP